MMSAWFILAAVLGQTTQPVEAAAPRTSVSVPAVPVRVTAPTTRPAPAMSVSAGASTRPAADGLASALVPSTQPEETAAMIENLGQLSQDPIEVQVTPNGDVVVIANEQDLDILQSLIQQMERQPGIDVTYEIFKLKNAQAADLATKVQDFWTKLKTPRTGTIRQQDKITVIAEPRANLLMVGAAAEAMQDVRGIIQQLDQPSLGDDMELTSIPLTHIKAVEAAATLTQLLKSRQDRLQATKTLIDITPDVRTNSLLISASKSDVEVIRKLIDVLDVPPDAKTGGVVKMALYPLRRAVGKELAASLNDMFTANPDAAKAAQEQIRRLQVQLRGTAGAKELPPIDLEKPIKVFADSGMNALIVATVEQNLEPIGALIEVMDTVPVAEEVLIRIFPLKHADADALLTNLKEIFAQGKELPTIPGRTIPSRTPEGIGAGLVSNVGLAADKRTNTLVVSGKAEQLLLVQRVIEAVDVEEQGGAYLARIVVLKNADVKRVAEVANKIADQRQKVAEKFSPTGAERERVLVIDDVRTNSLIVVAKEEFYQEIKALAEQLDAAPDDFLGQIRIINLENLTAADLASKISELWDKRAELRPEGNLKADKPVIVTDARSNSLIIASRENDYQAIVKLIDQLEQQKLSPASEVRLVVLKNNDAAKIGDTIKKIFDERMKAALTEGQKEQPGDRISVASDPLTNTLLVAASKANYEEIVSIVARLDAAPMGDSTVRTFVVKNADVKATADKIQQLFDKGVYRGSRTEGLPDSEKKIAIIPDMRSSTLIISASPSNFAVIEKLIQDLDRVDVAALPGDARFFPIHNADVVNVADMLTQLFEGMKTQIGDQKELLDVKIVPQIASNTLAIAGSRTAIKRAEELIPKLDTKAVDGASSVKVYDLKNASAMQLEKILTQLFEKRSSTEAAGKRTPINIIGDEGSNSLIVTAAGQDHETVQRMLTMLDRPSGLSEQMRVFPLSQAKATQVADKLTKLIEQQQGERKSGFGVTPDERTNALIVFASPDLMTQVTEIIDRLDTTRPATDMALEVFRLKNQNAEDLSKLLEEFFKAAGTGNEKDARQLIIKFSKMDPDTGVKLMHSLVHQDITIKPDKATNTLLVMAPESSIDMMGVLIEMLDSVEPRISQLASFQLRNADATEMKELLENLFGLKGEGGGGGGAQGEERRRFVFGAEGAGGAAPAAAGGLGGESAIIDLAFSVDRRTNTLIAAGSPAYLKMVERLVLQLDYEEIEERVVRVVPVHNKPAEEMATTLENYFKAESTVMKEAGGEGKEAALRHIQREVTIQDGGENSNLLLLTYSPRMEATVLGLINELDQPPPQVMIQVLMAEVTLNDQLEFGMEFALQDLLFSQTAFEGPNGTIQGNSFDFVGGTNLGAAGTGTGISFSITGEDFSYLVRALQTEGRLEVISRPAILVADKQDAVITVGERVPTVQDVVVSSNGIVTPSVTYEEVGVILDVTPIINPDGYVNLTIKPEISAIGTSSVTIASGVTLPTFTQRKAETVVMVKDGETIIIGGLITNRENDSENKVPLFGDIPFLGILGRSSIKSSTKTELLIVLTPHVVRTSEDARRIAVNMRDQTGMMENMRRNPLMQQLQVRPEEEQLGPIEQYRPRGEQTPAPQPGGEEMGPKLEELGPSAEKIQMGPDRSAVSVRTN